MFLQKMFKKICFLIRFIVYLQCIYPMIVDYQRDFLKDVEISLGKRTANSLFTKNGFLSFFNVFRLSLIILK